MNEFFLLQITQEIQKVNIPYYVHLLIIGFIMIGTGLLGGFAGYLIEKTRLMSSNLAKNKTYQEGFFKGKNYFMITGICAALLIPLFLSTISSQLMSESQKDPLKYFIFGGFCLLVAIFSKQFISSLSDKILKEVKEEVQQQTKENMEKAFDEKGGFITEQVEKQVNKQTSGIQNKLSVWDDFAKLESQIKHPTNPKELEIGDLTQILDASLQTGDPDLPAQVYDRTSILCYDLKHYDLMEQINEIYKDKIKLTRFAWADLAISNMNSYSLGKNPADKAKAEEYIEKSLADLKDYGVPYALKLYILMIEYLNLPQDDVRKKELLEEMKNVFKKVAELGNITSQEVLNYIKLNESTAFAGYNEQLIALFPEEWKELKKNAEVKKP